MRAGMRVGGAAALAVIAGLRLVRMRIARQTALLVALGLVMAIGFAVSVRPEGGRADTGTAGTAALVGQPDGLQPAVARLERDQRRDSLISQRSTKYPLILLAVFTGLAVVCGESLRHACASGHLSLREGRWWFRSGGRAPPLVQLTVI